MVPAILLYLLAALGIAGTIGLITIAIIVLYRYNGTPAWSFRWYWRNWRLMQLSAIASLFFLAMAASYALLHESLGHTLSARGAENGNMVAALRHQSPSISGVQAERRQPEVSQIVQAKVVKPATRFTDPNTL